MGSSDLRGLECAIDHPELITGDIGHGVFDHQFFVGVIALQDRLHAGQFLKPARNRPSDIGLVVQKAVGAVHAERAEIGDQFFKLCLHGAGIKIGYHVKRGALGLAVLNQRNPVKRLHAVHRKFLDGFNKNHMTRGHRPDQVGNVQTQADTDHNQQPGPVRGRDRQKRVAGFRRQFHGNHLGGLIHQRIRIQRIHHHTIWRTRLGGHLLGRKLRFRAVVETAFAKIDINSPTIRIQHGTRQCVTRLAGKCGQRGQGSIEKQKVFLEQGRTGHERLSCRWHADGHALTETT